MPCAVHAVKENDGTWSVYTWDGEPLHEGLTKEQAEAKVDRFADSQGDWTPPEWADDPMYDECY